MKYYTIVLALILLFIGCNKRECECQDDLHISWKDDKELECHTIIFPNAVVTDEFPFLFIVSLKEQIEWQSQKLKFYQGDQIFLDLVDVSEFNNAGNKIQIPNEIFTNSEGEMVTGPVQFEIEISFPQNNTSAKISGSTYFYQREEIENDFEPVNCRFPNQLLEINTDPC